MEIEKPIITYLINPCVYALNKDLLKTINNNKTLMINEFITNQ